MSPFSSLVVPRPADGLVREFSFQDARQSILGRLYNQWSGKEQGEKLPESAIVIKGKPLPCEWTVFKVSFDAGGKIVEGTAKVWVSSQVPLNGLVKMENEVGGNKSIMELVDYGRGK